MITKSHRTWFKVIFNPILRKFGWSIVSVFENDKLLGVIKGEIVKLFDVIEVKEDFFDSQAKTKPGEYKLQLVSLKDIDVVYKGVATREFFDWEDRTNFNNIKRNFQKTPPVILEEFEGKYYSVDGHHRITIANELGLNNILSFVIKVNKLTYQR
jgi:hypothetical protein